LHFLEQPRVFDRDYGLVGEGIDEFDLALVNGRTSGRVKARTPIASSSRNIGTARTVLKLPSSRALTNV